MMLPMRVYAIALLALVVSILVPVSAHAEGNRPIKALGAELQVPEGWTPTPSTIAKGAVTITETADGSEPAVIEIFRGDSFENTELEGLISQLPVEVSGQKARRLDWKDEVNRGFAVILDEAGKTGTHLTLSFRGPLQRWKELKPVFATILANAALTDSTSGGLTFNAPKGWTKAEFKREKAKTIVFRNPAPSPDSIWAVTVSAMADGQDAAPASRQRFEAFLGRYVGKILQQASIDDVDETEVAGSRALVADLSGSYGGDDALAKVMLIEHETGSVIVTALAGADATETLGGIESMFDVRDGAGSGVPEMVAFEPGPLTQMLFDGRLDDRWATNEAAGGRYADHASFEDGALTVRVPEQNGWAKVGLLSKEPIVWLDDFGQGAEITLTFSYDPARTTGIGIGIGPGRAYDAWSMPGVYIQWNVSSDRTGTILSVIRGQTQLPGSPFRRDGDVTAPSEITVRIRPDRFIVEVPGFAPVDVPDANAEALYRPLHQRLLQCARAASGDHHGAHRHSDGAKARRANFRTPAAGRGYSAPYRRDLPGSGPKGLGANGCGGRRFRHAGPSRQIGPRFKRSRECQLGQSRHPYQGPDPYHRPQCRPSALPAAFHT